MDIVPGTVVKATAGRDKNSFFVVLSVSLREVYLCDGKGRTLEHPKRKNIIHVAPTATVLNVQQLTTNSAVKKAISALTE